MKKVYLLMLGACCSMAVIAQPPTKTQTPAPAPSVKVEPQKDSHEGHNHGPVASAPAAIDLNKPVAEDNLGLAETSFNFGKIPQGKPVTHEFAINNTGKTELKLDNVQASCGCTTPQWSAGPYKPGEKAVITVGYNAAAPGQFTKTITVTYNGGLSKTITITGEVWQAPATPAPENKGVAGLKTGGN